MAQQIGRDYGALDGLVNNAGISLIVPAEQTSAEQWQRVMAINLFAPFLLCRYLGAQMLDRRRGSIVNVASIAGLAGVSHRSAYNASKHGLIGLTETLAAEWGGRGVRVNAVCPGWIKTEMDTADQGAARTAMRISSIACRWHASRAPEDVAEAIAFLLDRIAADSSTGSAYRSTAAGWPMRAGTACGCAPDLERGRNGAIGMWLQTTTAT